MVRSAPVAYFILLRFISVRIRRRLAFRIRPPITQQKSVTVIDSTCYQRAILQKP
jgi:hypothetical protein